jgi:hypothetical protein
MEIQGLLIVWHLACAVWAGMIGEQRRCGFIAATLAWLLFPLLGLTVILSSERK